MGAAQPTQFVGGYRTAVCGGQLYIVGGMGRNSRCEHERSLVQN